ncbi:4-hydroxy-tetrahydrodipicolinate reductase [Candidatus Liberibacter africanus]|uniref:4-hydroxy-tetrahydrodipicolinate reductase n=1 Tax=Candidatus Liberibacter africanus PTSAPSY TaxID=1277257 RepID=A0A0G3I5V5_LIBAF|nr:4-hydroxy-tetrahydrodipicolinate reductase [Candidatus Liberibacter africanus]AKK19848.1 dihydrodipicolinate reductase [Candidatus Liberibacter africanus PTSAPSY]QTP63708.1 4-hydroxy-tetrahydrodipicolinate reductase [Candidatus Liberibacter africanus]
MQQLPMKVSVLGGGRMGKALIKEIHNHPSIILHSVIVRSDSPLIGQDVGNVIGISPMGVMFSDDLVGAFQSVDGIIDFSSPALTLQSLNLSSQRNLVHIIGTTGFSVKENEMIASFAKNVRIVKSGNMSLGINFLRFLVEIAAEYFPGKDWDFEILEMHHRHKLDSPSGTALLLGEAIADGRKENLADHIVLNHNQQKQVRKEGSVGISSLRAGSIVGEHSVIIAGEGESITLSHSAYDRCIFARGSLTAALWAQSQNSGLYSMRDVLRFRLEGQGK